MRGVRVASRRQKRRRWRGAALVSLVLAFAHGAKAAPASLASVPALPTDAVLAKLIEQSLAVRPELTQAHAEVTAERERGRQAGTLPDPMLQLGVQNDGFTAWEVGKMETSWYSVMASQTFPWPGKLRLRREAVELGASQAEERAARVRLSTEAGVRRAYLNVILARDRLALLDRLEAIWQKSAALALTRYETGQGAQSDVLRAQLEQNRIRQRRWAMQADEATELQSLNRLRGHPLDEPIETASHLTDFPLPTLRDPTVAAGEALERSPELAAARLAASQAERELALGRKSYLPDFTVTVGVMPRGGEFPPMWLASVGIPLPVFAGSKQSRAVAEGEARLLARQTNSEGLSQVLRLRVEQRRTALGVLLETIRLYQEGLLVQSEATADSTLAQYEVGKVTFISVLEANAGFIADQDGYLQTLAQAHRLEIDRLEVSLGPTSAPGVVPAAPITSGSDSSSMSSMAGSP
jgi:outer membrane protein, heavy metal efflux system